MPTPAELFDLTGKVAVVTGGSRGLGVAIVHGLAAAGADVVVASRKLYNCKKVAADVEENYGRRALAVSCHVAHWDQCDALVETSYDHFGKVDVFVSNAGMSPLYPDLASVTEELYDKVHGVNLKGPFRLGALFGTRMYEGDGGSIINVGTVGSLMPSWRELPYTCAKAGLNALTVGLADAFAPKVRVNAILPGAFDTDASKHWPSEQRNNISAPLARMADPEEFVGAVLYFASNASSYATGAILRVDGGVTRRV
ncbi:MAG: SDR family oxidoreductase [Actinobacteria bacterium]|nr:MAG: SDR family oxidoreductase [Actinomycetota bacterium]